MTIAIMQPYLFPYLAYFALIKSVDLFVVYDEGFWIKGGRVNRNLLEVQGRPHLFTLPILHASPNRQMNEMRFGTNRKILRMVRHGYSRSPHLPEVIQIVHDTIEHSDRVVSRLTTFGLQAVMEHLGITTRILVMSEMERDRSLRGLPMIIDVCKRLGATIYVNQPGGRAFYKEEDFAKHGIELRFMHDSGPGLSVIHDMLVGDAVRKLATL